jgi:hypothetical protein
MKGNRIKRLQPVTKLVDSAKASGEFGGVFYRGARGQPGVWVAATKTVAGTTLEATLRVESDFRERGYGYGATETKGSRIGYLSITKTGERTKQYPPWDPDAMPVNRHNFENDPQEIRDFSRLILKYFSV